MPTPSISQILQVVAKVEVTYGTDAAPVGGTDDALLIDSDTPLQPTFNTFEIRAHGNSFTRRQDIVGSRWIEFDLQFALQGSGALGATANGFSGQSAILQSCGVTQTLNAGTSTVWAPAARSALKSATIWVSMDGVRHKIQGCYGTATLTANPRGGMLVRYTGRGLYNDPEDGANGTISGFVGGTNRAEAFFGVACTVTRSGGSAYTPILDNVEMTLNAVNDPVDDANSNTGVNRFLYTDRAERLVATYALDTDAAANLAYKQFYSDIRTRTSHAIVWGHGTTPSKHNWSFPTAQPLGIRIASKKYRTIAVTYKVPHNTDESQWSDTIN